jgi:two-component system, CAI-1 autoinducer sensor kinase/phosphatase CqsS
MTVSAYIRKSLDEGTRISRFNLTWAAWLSLLGHLFFFGLLKYGFDMPYENFMLRLIASLLGLGAMLFLRSEHPFAKRYFPAYWHFSLMFNLPFLFTLFLLKNNFHELWLYWEIFMIFVLIAFVPNWLMFLFDLCVGVLAGVAFFMLTTPDPRLTPDFDIPAYTTAILLSVVAGYLISYSNRRGLVAMEKNTALQALAGSIAHEMRNPLNQVKLNLEIIEEQLPVFKRGDRESAQKMIDDLYLVLDSLYQHVGWCQIAVRRGTQIISMILNEVKDQPLDARGFIYASAALVSRKAIDEYGFESAAERNKVEFDGRDDFMFRINETMYVFVLFNLLKNALYVLESRPEEKITITLERGEKYNVVKVHDSGPGIPSENIGRLFDPYFTASKKGGTGLGLSYCKRVMQAFGGGISCSSVEGEYTEFVLMFPVVTPGELQAGHERLVEENRSLLALKRILVVDDRDDGRETVRETLAPLVAFIGEASNGEEALKRLSDEEYDLVIMNLAMPLLDGYEATRLVRDGAAGGRSAVVPVIAYTEQPFAIAEGKARKAGMQGVVGKPCTEYELVREIARVFREYQGLDLARLKGMNVLIADDSAVNRIGIAMMMQKYGIVTDEAENGLEVLQKVQSGAFDLVLMDIGMPGINGIEATKKMRSSSEPRISGIRVIGFSGESDEQSIRDALASGMNDYVVKPVDFRMLLEKINALY